MIRRNSFKEFWEYRQVAVNFFVRDYKVFYRDAFLGIFWSLLQPLSIMMVFYFLFHKVMRFQVGTNISYPLLLLSGIVSSQFFTASIGMASTSLKDSLPLMQRVYIPKYIPALVKTMNASIDFLMMTLILVGLASYNGFVSWKVCFLPLIFFFSFLLFSFIAVVVSFFVALFKDFKFIVDFALRIIFFISPVGYTHLNVPEKYRELVALNPLFPMIHLFRWSLFGEKYSELNYFLLFSFGAWILFLFFLMVFLIRTIGDSILD